MTPASGQRRDSIETDRIPYLYIAGASYTGSTLLAFLLNAHSRMASVSEVCGVLPSATIPEDAIESYWCSCGVLLLQCPFYRELKTRIEDLGSTFDLRDWRTHFQFSRSRITQLLITHPLRFRALQWMRDSGVKLLPGFKRTAREVGLRSRHFAQATLAISGKQVFVDAQKDALRIRFLSEIPELDLKVVHLVRDARAGAASYMKHEPDCDAKTAARRWLRANVSAERARSYVEPNRWMRILYEELCSDYQNTVDRIADFVGVPRAAVPEDFGNTEHHIVGNTMRRGKRRGITLDESWKTRLTAGDLAAIRRVAGKWNRTFGFDWPPTERAGSQSRPGLNKAAG